MLLFSEEGSVNSRAVAGYWDAIPIEDDTGSVPVESLKNTIVISPSTLLPESSRSTGDSPFNTSPDTDAALGLVKPDKVINQNNMFRQKVIREKIRNTASIKKRIKLRKDEYIARRLSTRGFTKWLKNQKPEVHDRLSSVGLYMKKSLMEKLKNIYIGPNKDAIISPNSSGNGWTQSKAGGKRKNKKSKRKNKKSKRKTKKNKRRKNKTKRKLKNKKHKTNRRKKKRRRRTRRK